MRDVTQLSAWATLLVVLAACAGTPSQHEVQATSSQPPSTSSSAQPASVPFKATIDNTAVGGVCAQEKINCWQPTQLGPRFVEKEGVSLEELTTPDGAVTRAGWPNNKDEVEVLCISTDPTRGIYRNPDGQTVNDWHGIRIPVDKVEPTVLNDPRLKKAPDGNGYLGFVSTMWLKGIENVQMPACPIG